MTQIDPLSDLLDTKVISGGLASILEVSDPAESTVEVDYPVETIMRVFALLGAIVHRDPNLWGGANEDILDAEAPEWGEAYRKSVVFVVWLLGDDKIRDKILDGGEGNSLAVQFIQVIGSPEEVGLTENIRLERFLLFAFITGLNLSQLMKVEQQPLNSILSFHPDLMIFDMLALLTSVASLNHAYGRAAGSMANCLSSVAAKSGRIGHDRERERWQTTADSMLRLQELALLANCMPPQVAKYGKEKIAVRFEQQLNLAFQLLGFFTRPAARGERQGDIICLTDEAPPRAVLIEAKTSAQPYKLPVSDERALSEYAQQNIPFQLRLICIIGPKPGDKLAGRLHLLERKVGIPVRYCEAALVAFLLSAPTRVVVKDLVGSLISADQIISQSDLESMLSRVEKKATAWKDVINSYAGPGA